METNVLCERKEQVALSDLFERINVLLQDCDDIEEKEKMKKALQKMNETTSYMILGEVGVGKTSILKSLFQDIFEPDENILGDICEYRWGEQEFLTPVSDGIQKRFLTNENIKGLSIYDSKGLNCIGENSYNRICKLAESCDSVFVVVPADHVNSSSLWDMIEGFPDKKMIFFLTKCDLVSEEELKANLNKLDTYMKDSNITAPVFAVSTVEDGGNGRITSLEEVRSYIRNQVIGVNPMLNKQWENVEETKKLLIQLQKSFSLRKKQYLSDAEILQKINLSMDDYVANHKKTLAVFLKKLEIEINKDIDSYQQEIISKMDPYKIKERFRKKEDFQDYLNMVNENYKNMMNESVNRKTIEVIKECLHDLEIIFNEATGYFNTRENIMELNDRFYGSLAKSRKQMVAETKEVVVSTGELYRTLSDASETLFLQIWNARKKYDLEIRKRRKVSTAVGATVGTAGGVGGGFLLAAITTTALDGLASASLIGTIVGITGGIALVGIGVIVGAVVINSIVKDLWDPKAADRMEETTQKCIEQFKAEVNNTRQKMLEQISVQVTEIFENEIATVDGCFTEFRMSVNIDERKLPMLEQKLIETEKIMQQIDMI